MDTRDVMPILEDSITLEGHTLNRVSEGENPIHDEGGANERNKDGLIGFGFKDSDGNLVLPKLNTDGSIVVTFDAGTAKHNRAEVLAAALTKDTKTAVAIFPLTADEKYNSISGQGSCTRLCLMQIAYVIDRGEGTEVVNILTDGIVGAGNFTVNMKTIKMLAPTGAITHELILFATPLETKTSTVRADINCNLLE